MRKFYLDNLRSIMILLLFPVHTFMIWNNYGSKFYIWNGESNVLSTLITLVNPWFMAILFVIAGMCARYSLGKRNSREFVKGRFYKLFLPFVSGMLLLVPVQTFYARKFFFSYDGSFIDNYKFFFTHFTDLSGYDGGFTPGHLWFLLFLFIISLVSLLVTKYVSYEKISFRVQRMNIIGILLLGIPVWLFYYLGNFGGFSLGKYFALYLLGYYVLSNESILEKLFSHKRIVILLFFILQTTLTALYYKFSYYGDFLVNCVGWFGVLSCFIVGKMYLNHKTRISEYFSQSSFGIYIFHQSILVILGYYVLRLGMDSTLIKVLIIMLSSFLVTVIVYEIIRRIPYIRTLFGIKYTSKSKSRNGGAL